MNNNDLRRNSEGYADPTAYKGMIGIIQKENALDREVNALIKVIKFIVSRSGFELISRIELRDVKTGREFK